MAGQEPSRGDRVNLTINGNPQELGPQEEPAAPFTVSALLVAMELPPVKVAVEVNGQIVPRAQHPQHALKSGDIIEVVTLVGGG
jgi:sulfur carrier protein